MKRAITVIPIVLLTFVVSCTDTSEQAARRKQPPLLKKEQIDDFINAKLNRDRSAMEARIALDRASLALGSTDKADHLGVRGALTAFTCRGATVLSSAVAVH